MEGAWTGAPATGDATLRFSALSGVSAMSETVPLDQAAAAYAKMMAWKARFRMVLVTKDGAGQSFSALIDCVFQRAVRTRT